jgi:hypothetical protein
MWILEVFPGHAGCYYILGFILFVLNKLEEAIILLEMSRAVDPNFEPVDGKFYLVVYFLSFINI